jgi:hypothetical protein
MPSSADYRWSELLTRTAGSALLAAIAGVSVGILLAANPLVVGLLLAIPLALLVVWTAFHKPAAAFVGLVLIMALIPTYAAPAIGPLLFVPAAGAGWLVGAALAWRNSVAFGQPMRPNLIDWTAGGFALLMLVSVSFSGQVSLQDYTHLMFLWAGPYLAARLLLADVENPAYVVAIAFAAAAAIVTPFAVFEALGASNPFHALNFNGTEFAVWQKELSRFGQSRAVASFGHPIAFSMFMAISALLSIAMAIRSKESRARHAWYGAAAVAIGVQALALSRTGWLMLAAGVIMIAALSVRGTVRRRLTTLIGIAVGVVVVTAIVMPKKLAVLPGFEQQSEASFSGSGQYRQALLHRALEPGVLHLWGNPINRVTPFVGGSTGTDNAYIILADAWGLIPTAALILVAAVMLVPLARGYARDDEGLTVLPIVALTSLVALFFVAFITQQQSMIWLLVGSAAAANERIGPRRPSSRGAPAGTSGSTSTGFARTA